MTKFKPGVKVVTVSGRVGILERSFSPRKNLKEFYHSWVVRFSETKAEVVSEAVLEVAE